jgi:diguanylate cyclase (GGDEF)-like protein
MRPQAALTMAEQGDGMRLGVRAKGRGPGINWLIGSILLTLLILSAALVNGFISSARLADSLDQQEKTRLIRNYLEDGQLQLAHEQKAQVSWDDAFLAVGSGYDLDWADAYFGTYLWSNFKHGRLFLVRPDGVPIAVWRDGKRTALSRISDLQAEMPTLVEEINTNARLLDAPTSFLTLQDTRWPAAANGRPIARWAGRVISFEGKPALLAATSIIPDAKFGLLTKTPNFLISVRPIDSVLLARMQEMLQLDGLEVRRELPSGAEKASVPITTTRHGRQIGHLVWNAQRPGAAIIKTTSPLLIALISYCMAAMLLVGMIFRRVRMTARELSASQAQAVHVALHDPMSDLPNRTNFQQALSVLLLDLAESQEDEGVIIAYIDIDRFKDVNDTLGHQAGDDLICLAAERLRLVLQPSDMLARFGGDEFVIMRRQNRVRGAISQIGATVMAAFQVPFTVMGHELDVTASCGIAWSPNHGTTVGELLRNADIALYQAKARGRGRWRAFTPDMDENLRARREIELELRRAIVENQLEMVYQPIFAARTGQISSLEALVRWHHPRLGIIAPDVFVPIAEQTGQMRMLGSWIMERVFEDQRYWPGVRTAINLSPVEITHSDFVARVAEMVDNRLVDPRKITFEITEGVLLDHSEKVLGILSALHALGFRIALDDFGTGYSSLSYLRRFEFDDIKIDRSFVRNIDRDPQAFHILKAIVGLGSSLGMNVVAEGVETESQNQRVTDAGCHNIQGFYHSQPVSRSEAIRLLGAKAGRARGLLRRAA